MLKKLLTLSLVAVILSVTAFATPTPMAPMTAALAETDEQVIVDVPPTIATADDMEILTVTPGESGATIASYNWGYYTPTQDKDWLLVKVAIGKNWVMNETTMKLQVRLRYAGTATANVAPLTKAEFDSAVIAMEKGETISELKAPVNVTNKDTKSDTNDVRGQATIGDIELEKSYYGENNYVDGCLYMAIQYTGTLVEMQPAHKSYYNLTLSGKRVGTQTVVPATSGAFVTGATAGEQTIDCDIALDIGTRASAKNWAAYKFTMPANQDVAKVEFTIDAKGTTSYANFCVYCLTEAEYTATVTDGDRTLKTADKQTLLENVLGSTTRKEVHPATRVGNTQKTETLDVTSLVSEQAKSGNVYIVAFAIDKTTVKANNTRLIDLKNPSLAIYVVPGETEPVKVNDFSDTVLMWNGKDNSFDVCTQTTTGKAVLIAATYSGTTMVDAKLVSIDAASKRNGAISGTVSDLTIGEGETLKVYLWEDGTLTPIKNVIEF